MHKKRILLAILIIASIISAKIVGAYKVKVNNLASETIKVSIENGETKIIAPGESKFLKSKNNSPVCISWIVKDQKYTTKKYKYPKVITIGDKFNKYQVNEKKWYHLKEKQHDTVFLKKPIEKKATKITPKIITIE